MSEDQETRLISIGAMLEAIGVSRDGNGKDGVELDVDEIIAIYRDYLYRESLALSNADEREARMIAEMTAQIGGDMFQHHFSPLLLMFTYILTDQGDMGI